MLLLSLSIGGVIKSLSLLLSSVEVLSLCFFELFFCGVFFVDRIDLSGFFVVGVGDADFNADFSIGGEAAEAAEVTVSVAAAAEAVVILLVLLLDVVRVRNDFVGVCCCCCDGDEAEAAAMAAANLALCERFETTGVTFDGDDFATTSSRCFFAGVHVDRNRAINASASPLVDSPRA